MRTMFLAAAMTAAFGSLALARDASAKTTDPLAIEAVHNYGRCVAQRSPRPAIALLAQDFRTEGYHDRMRRFAEGHSMCVPGGRLAFHGVLFAGALAEALLEAKHSESRLPFVLEQIPNPPIPARDETEMMALCTVRTAPAMVAKLLQQPVAAKEELRTMQALGPTLSGCLAKEQKLNVNRPGIRAILALAAWRIAQGSPG